MGQTGSLGDKGAPWVWDGSAEWPQLRVGSATPLGDGACGRVWPRALALRHPPTRLCPHPDYAEALINPIKHVSLMDQRAKQLAALIGEREVSQGRVGALWEATGLRLTGPWGLLGTGAGAGELWG